MPNKDKNIPKRRFKAFENDPAWELRKLNNIADVRDGTHNSPRYIEFGYPLVTSKNIKNGQVNFEDIQYISSFDYEEINKRSKVNINDILMGMIGTVGNLALVREEPKFAIKNVALIKNIGVVNVEFLYHYLGSYVIERQLQNSLDGGTQKFISLNKIRHLDITFPSLPEQEVIGTFFSTLDQHITLHQRKLDKLKSVKQAYLSEMFPAEGERVPKRRFPGFTDDWELRKLGEITEKQFGGGTPTTSNALFWEGNIPWIQSSDLEEGIFSVGPRKYITKAGLGNSSAQLIPKNSIAIVTRVGVGKLAFMPFTYTTSQDFLSISYLKTNELFTTYSLYIKLQNEIKVLQGTSIKGITKNELLIKEIPIPSLPEQEAIGTFFSTLDQQITLHQRKLEKLKNLKKALLNELFV
ncbi:restriction endonuclease subunit S [Streptococcus suis]|uniref:restriction endonuclease subunit S n=1 Tax=Streptococcus suis TaxID=1307 RepID=UPI000CF5BEAA|nr:restriction endonuclease subunit S [Streptococcus suis]